MKYHPDKDSTDGAADRFQVSLGIKNGTVFICASLHFCFHSLTLSLTHTHSLSHTHTHSLLILLSTPSLHFRQFKALMSCCQIHKSGHSLTPAETRHTQDPPIPSLHFAVTPLLASWTQMILFSSTLIELFLHRVLNIVPQRAAVRAQRTSMWIISLAIPSFEAFSLRLCAPAPSGGVPASPFGAFHTAGPSSSFPSSSSNGNGYAPSNPQPQPSPPPPPPPRHTIQRVDLSCSLEELFRGVRKVYMWVYARIKRYVCAKGREGMNRGTPSCVSAKLRCWTTFLAYPSLSLNTRKLSLSAPSYSP